MDKICNKKDMESVIKLEKNKSILDKISGEQASQILEILVNEDAKISMRVRELALQHLINIDPDDIAENVFLDLNSLDVEDVWENSGGTRDGYVDPDELSSEMFEDELKPYIDELVKCQKLSMDKAAKLHCMGILRGLYKFENESTTEFQDYVPDDPHENFIKIFWEWKKGNNDPKNLEEMYKFVERNFPEWSSDILKKR